ncbi:MAG: ABC transporter permease, partial [Oscillospiraceae bacterium]
QQIQQVEGVEQVSSQLFVSTLSAACCSAPVQVIGFDPATDFVVQPWIAKAYSGQIGDGQLVVGSEIVLDESGTLTFFNKSYPVVAQLGKTSTGMDYSVYANMGTVKSLVEGARQEGMNLGVDVYKTDMDNSISTVLVKLRSGYTAETVATNIRRQVSGIGVVQSKSIFSGIAANLSVFLSFISTFTAILWALAVVVLAVLFSVIANGRKKEFALLRSLGATRARLTGIVLSEALVVSGVGAWAGAGAAALVVFPFSTYIAGRLQLPYLLPGPGALAGLLAASLLLSFAVGPLAAAYSAVKTGRAEAHIALREGE